MDFCGIDWSRSRGGYSRQGGSPYQQSFGGGGGGGSYGGNQGPGPFGGGGGEGSYGGRQQGPAIQIPVGAPGNYG